MAAKKKNNYTLKRKKNPQHTKAEVEKIASELLEWAHSGEGIFIASYIYGKYKRPPKWIYQLARYHKPIKDALEIVKDLIAGKVGDHCWKGDRNSTFGEKILPMYSKSYKELLEWKEKIKKLDLSDDQLKTIVNIVNYAKSDSKDS